MKNIDIHIAVKNIRDRLIEIEGILDRLTKKTIESTVSTSEDKE